MGTVIVDVMPKREILDPQGQAVAGALARLGMADFTEVRQGKRFVLQVAGEVTEETLAAARQAADTLLSNPVIEDVVSVRAQQDIEPVRAQQDIEPVRAQQDIEPVRAQQDAT
jgi:phosphoribosylformylglycinamidine synthase